MIPAPSVLTLVRGRREPLLRQIQYLEEQTMTPRELVVAVMEPEPLTLPPSPRFEIVQVLVPGEELPLAAARNRAAAAAGAQHLIFLDVDCLPAQTLVASYANALERDGTAAYMGEVYYLPAMSQEQYPPPGDASRLHQLGERHPSKKPFSHRGRTLEKQYGELWGLSFALSKQVFEEVGGFDERFTGYGGEETDFAHRLQKNGTRLFRLARAEAFHQHHRVSIPPLQHFDSILRNAQLFREKWGRWCMDYWLGQFRDLRYIEWNPQGASLEVLRSPSAHDIQLAKQGPEIRFS